MHLVIAAYWHQDLAERARRFGLPVRAWRDGADDFVEVAPPYGDEPNTLK